MIKKQKRFLALNVYRSLTNIYAQVVSASSLEKEIKSKLGYCGNKQAAREVGKLVVVFDRGGYIYHGRVKELAEGAREAGLEF